MKNKYKNIIAQLRETEPVLENKEELANIIVSLIRENKSILSKEVNVFKTVIRPVITVAAIFLIGFFLFEQSTYSSFSNQHEISKTNVQKELLNMPQSKAMDKELSEEFKFCINKVKSNSEEANHRCVIKLLRLYKEMEKQQTKSYKQKLRNWLNQ